MKSLTTIWRKGREEMVKEFTAWQNIKAMLSDNCLKWALQLLPSGSPEAAELAVFLKEYLERSIKLRGG